MALAKCNSKLPPEPLIWVAPTSKTGAPVPVSFTWAEPSGSHDVPLGSLRRANSVPLLVLLLVIVKMLVLLMPFEAGWLDSSSVPALMVALSPVALIRAEMLFVPEVAPDWLRIPLLTMLIEP